MTSSRLTCKDTGDPSSAYEHRNCCFTFEILGSVKGKKVISVTYECEKI